MPIVKLIEAIDKERSGTTKQGVYNMIRKLKRQEIVVVHNKSISLSGVWLSAMEEFFAQARNITKSGRMSSDSFLNLAQGEKIQYYFRDPILTDAFWSHIFITLVDVSAPKTPVLIYNPHEWFLLVRTDNEVDLFKRIHNRGQQLAVLAGNATALDKSARSFLKDSNAMYETLAKPLFPKNNYYVNIIADFVIEVWIDQKISIQLDEFYKQSKVFNDADKQRLEQILMQKGRNRFSITHNKRKADALRKKIGKYFFLHRESDK